MKKTRTVFKHFLIAPILFLAIFTCRAQEEDIIIKGKVSIVYDGDTYLINTSDNQEIKVRLLHIDCPEKDQPYGAEAKYYAESRIKGRNVIVYIKDYDQYDRALGLVMEENGSVFNYELLTLGYAWHYAKYSDDLAASALQQFAKESSTGLWAFPNPIAPWNYRNQ
ncbi:MAG: thermonuclease family protein [Balneola sp.]